MPGLIDQNPGQADDTLPKLPKSPDVPPQDQQPDPPQHRPQDNGPLDAYPDNSIHTPPLLVERAKQYKEPSWWLQSPETATGLLTSNIPEEHHQILASYTPAMADWITRRNAFGGVNGALIKVRLTALQIADPQLRARELATINSIAQLSPSDQAMFIAYANNPAAFAGTNPLAPTTGDTSSARSAVSASGPSQATSAVSHILGEGTVDPNTGQINVSGNITSADQVVALEQLFPQLQGKIHFEDGSGVTLQDWKESFDANQSALAAPFANPILEHGVNPLSVGEGILGAGFNATMAPFHDIGGILHEGENAARSGAQAAGLGGVATPVLSQWDGITGAAYRRFNYAMGTTANTLGRFILEGRIPGTNVILRKGATQALGKDYVPPSDETTNFVGQIATAVALHGVTEGAGEITSSLSGPAEVVGDATGVAGEEGLAGTLAGLSPKEVLLHPLREGMDPFIRKATWDVAQQIHATGWADWVQGRMAGSVFDFAARHAAEADYMGKMQERYPTLPPEYLLKLRDTAREDMPQATLDYADEASKGSDATTLKAQSSSFQAKINSQAKAVDQAREFWKSMNSPTDRYGEQPMPNVQATPDTLQALDDTVTRLTADYSELPESQRAAFKFPDLSETSAENWTQMLQKALDHDEPSVDATPFGDGVYRIDDSETGGHAFVKTDGDGNVVSVRDIDEHDVVTAQSTEAAKGNGYGVQLILKHWADDHGITDLSPENVAKLQGVLDTPGSSLSEEGAALNRAAIKVLNGDRSSLTALRAAQNELDNLKLDKAAVDAKLVDAANAPAPVLRFPGRRTLPDFLHRVLYRPSSLAERAFRGVISPRTASQFFREGALAEDGAWLTRSEVPAIAKLVDKLSSDAKLVYADPSLSSAARTVIHDGNATILNRMLAKMHVPQGEIAAAISKLAEAKSQTEWWNTVNNDIFGNKGVIARFMPENIPSAFRERIIGTSDRDPLNFNHSVMENGHTEPIVPGPEVQGVPTPLPSAPHEFQNQIGIPSPSAIEDAYSAARRFSQNARQAAIDYKDVQQDVLDGTKLASDQPGFFAKSGPLRVRTAQAGAYVLDFSRASLHLTTAGLKVPALLLNLPAIILTKVLDESVGNANTPGLSRVIKTSKDAVDYYTKIEPDQLGTVISGFFGEGTPGVGKYMEVPAAQMLSKGGNRAVFNSMIDRLNQIHDDPMLSAFAQTGLDIPQMRELVTGGDVSLTKFFDEQVAPQLDRAGMTTDEWLGRWAQSIRESTLNEDPRWMEYAAHGRMRGANGSLRLPDGSDGAVRYARLQSDIGGIQTSLEDLSPLKPQDELIIGHLQDILRQKYSEMRFIEDEAKANGVKVGGDGVIRANRQNPAAAAREMQRQFTNNEITLPDRVRVNRTVSDINTGGVHSIPEIMDEWAQKFGNTMYSRSGKFSFQSIGRTEAKTARGSFYSQLYDRYMKESLAGGSSAEDAAITAHFRALEQTRDMFYDLTARSSFERSVRNVMWFAPVNAELLYRWLYAIPAQSGGMLPGLALLASKAANYENMFKGLGVITKDPSTGQDVVTVPGLANFLSGITNGGFRLPTNNVIPIQGLSPHLSSPIPELAPIPAAALNKVAEYIPAIRGLAQAVAPYSDVTIVPTAIRNFAAMTGHKIPDVSNDYVNQQWDRTHDQAYQLAFHSLQQEGDNAPTLAQFHLDPAGADYSLTDANQKAYEDSWGQWFDRLSTRADEYARGTYFAKLVSGVMLPGNITSSDPDQVAFENFWKSSVLPQLQPGQPMPDSVRATLDKWLGDHPESIAFSVSYNAYTNKTWQPDHVSTDGTDYTQLYLHGAKATMDPTDYANLLGAMTSRETYTQRARAEIDRIAPNGDAPTLLRNWGDRSQAMTTSAIAWENYLVTHPQADAIIKTNSANMQAEYGIAPDSIEAHYVKDALLSLKALSGYFTGQGGLQDQDVQSVIGKMKALNASLYQTTGGQLTPMEQGISWYFDSVLTPYMNATQSLYDKAAKLQAAGKDTTQIYAQIGKIKEQYSNPTNGGESYPSPDEFFYGSKDPQEKDLARLNWTTKPVSWLSPFQRDTIGYQSFKGEDAMFKAADGIRTYVQQQVDSGAVSPGSKAYDALQQWSVQTQNSIAQNYGAKGIAAMKLNLASPYERLQQSGFGQGNDSMQNVFGMVGYVQQTLQQEQLSAGGYSTNAIALKQWLYGYITQQESSDPRFKRLMQQLSLSQTALPSGMHPTGVPLWESIFFGNYNPAYIPNSLINSVPNGVV